MIKAISYWSMKEGLAGTHPIKDALQTAKKEGFAGLELAISTSGELTIETSQQRCAEIQREIEAADVIVETVASGMSWGTNPTSDDAPLRQRAVEQNAAALQRAAWLGAQAVLFVPGVVKSPIAKDVIRYDVALERAREAVKRLLDTAERVGVDLCVENVWNGMFYSPAELADFVDSFGSGRLGVYFDVGNVLGYHQHPPHWIEMLGKRIRRVHIKDFKQNVGTLAGFCDLMAGDVPWPETMAALRAVGYDRTVVAEMMPWDPALLSRTSAAMDVILKQQAAGSRQ
jgi:L-ribulose-5-phosphate 3-epimerase